MFFFVLTGVPFEGNAQSHGTLLAFEEFKNYSAGDLAGQPLKGAGFAAGGHWSGFNDRFQQRTTDAGQVAGNGLRSTFVACDGGRFTIKGNNSNLRALLDLSSSGPFAAVGLVNRETGMIGGGSVNSILWISFLFRADSGNRQNEYGGLQLCRSDSERQGVLIGNSWPAQAYSCWDAVKDASVDLKQFNGTGNYYTMDEKTHLLVVKIVYDAGREDEMTVWLDPEPSAGEQQQNLPTTYTGRLKGDFSFDRIMLRGGAKNPFDFSEIRIGTTWNSVLPPYVSPDFGAFGTACLSGELEAALVLAHSGEDANKTNEEGDTVLHVAAEYGWDQSVYTAVAAGANPALKNSAGLTAHEIAAANNNFSVLAKLSESEWWQAPQFPPERAPDFTVSDLDGQSVSLSSFRGHAVALFFLCEMGWDKSFHYTWLDYAQKLQESPEGKSGKLVVLVATPDNPASAKKFFNDRNYTFRTLSDPKDTIRSSLGLYAMPAVLFDSDGALRWERRMWQCNKIEDHGLFLAVEKILANDFIFRTAPASGPAADNNEQLLYDFENNYDNWKLSGDCWEKNPATDALYPGLVKGYAGRSYLSTFGHAGFAKTGLAVSPEFEINKGFLHMLVGGGDYPDHCAIVLVCDGCTVRRANGRNTAELEPVCWDVRDLAGKKAHFEVYDCGTTEPRDFIMVDQIVASDSAALPAAYAHRFDPNDAKDSAAVAGEVPDGYKALQAGEFHEEATPGRTYVLEMSKGVDWPNENADWLELHFDPCPTHHAQIFRSFTMSVEIDGKTFEGRPVSNGRLFEPQTWVCYIPATHVTSRHGIAKMTEVMTAKQLKIVAGESPDNTPLPQYVREIMTSSSIPYTNEVVRQFITRNKLWRWPEETDAAYFLRAYRFFQRDFSYVNVPWGGWPTPEHWPWPAKQLAGRAMDCSMVSPMGVLLRANGIPAEYEQGGWTHQGEPHVKGLTYLRKVGWLYNGVSPDVSGPWPFAVGHGQGDNFLGHRLDWSTRIPNFDPPNSKVLHGRFSSDDEWWHYHVVSE